MKAAVKRRAHNWFALKPKKAAKLDDEGKNNDRSSY
jgi:hypothetical protein